MAEAVIVLLAREGGRGLTHGNIDKYLKLPKGSTSFYYRRRAELFEAGLCKLVEQDLDDLNGFMSSLFKTPTGTIQVREVARCQYKLWQRTTQPRMRFRSIARFEFFLHAARDKRFNEFHADVRKQIFDFGAMMFARLGARNPRRAAEEYGYLVRGDAMAFFVLPTHYGGHQITSQYYESRLREIIDRTNRLPTDSPALPKREHAF
jgi:TetR/AcrR family transcriptional regulator, regulator of biofilm formation and stress response